MLEAESNHSKKWGRLYNRQQAFETAEKAKAKRWSTNGFISSFLWRKVESWKDIPGEGTLCIVAVLDEETPMLEVRETVMPAIVIEGKFTDWISGKDIEEYGRKVTAWTLFPDYPKD